MKVGNVEAVFINRDRDVTADSCKWGKKTKMLACHSDLVAGGGFKERTERTIRFPTTLATEGAM